MSGRIVMGNVLWVMCLLGLVLLVTHQSSLIRAEAATKTSQRLNSLIKYHNQSGKFSNLEGEKQQKAYKGFVEFLEKAVEEGKNCYKDKETQTSEQRKACDRVITANHSKAKQFNRLLKYYQIEQKSPFVCVKADLGEGTKLRARGISNPEIFANPSLGSKETGRTELSQVFLCTGEAGQKKLRVQGGSGRLYKLTPDDLKRPELQLNNLPPKSSLEALEKEIGV